MGAFRIGVAGLPNSGKSFSWKYYKKGEEVFAILPSSKILHVRKSDGSLLSPLKLSTSQSPNIDEIAKAMKLKNGHEVIRELNKKDSLEGRVEISGDYVLVSDVKYVKDYKLFVSRFMPSKKIILSPDFTHYISYIIQTPVFMSRKQGGEAFQRFWDLAADVLRNVILSSDELRDDILDFTEFHMILDKDLELLEVYTPAGNMLVEKFKPETYFDLFLPTYIVPYEQEKNEENRFKFVINQQGIYPGRSINLFSDIAVNGMIPNDMSIVIPRIREYLGQSI